MKELTNKKNKQVHLLTEEEFAKIKELGLAGHYFVKDVEPIGKMIPTPTILKAVEVETIKKKKRKDD
jgi:hypothetical protein